MTDAPVTAQEQPTCKRHEIPMVLLYGSCTCDQGVIEEDDYGTPRYRECPACGGTGDREWFDCELCIDEDGP